MFVEGDGAAESDQLMMHCSSEQQMALYEVCVIVTMHWAYYETAETCYEGAN